jgi:hypothetical protein
LDGGESVEFMTSIPVGMAAPAVSVRFTPQWVGGPPPPPAFPNAPSASSPKS